MTKKTRKHVARKEELRTVDSYIDGEEFTFHVPFNLDELELKYSKPEYYGAMEWSPWPTIRHVERRVGNFVLKLHPTKNRTRGFGRNRKAIPLKLIRLVDGDPEAWMYFEGNWNGRDDKKKREYPSFNGRHVLSVFKEDYPHLKASHDNKNSEGNRVLHSLRVPTKIPDEILKKVFGRSYARVETYTNFEFADRRNQFFLELEWYRKQLLKIRRKRNNEKKKATAAERGVSVKDIEREKKERAEMEKRIKRTQLWVSMSKDFHATLDWLQEFARRMEQDEDISQEWYDKGRRAMRKLPTTMQPLRHHFPKNK